MVVRVYVSGISGNKEVQLNFYFSLIYFVIYSLLIKSKRQYIAKIENY